MGSPGAGRRARPTASVWRTCATAWRRCTESAGSSGSRTPPRTAREPRSSCPSSPPERAVMTATTDAPRSAPTALLAEDEPMLRALLRTRLAAAWPELRIVGEAANGDEALALYAAHRPDIAFLDIRMPVRSGLE